MPRHAHPTAIDDGIIYIDRPEGRLTVGPVDDVLTAVGGPAWTISYSEWEKQRYPDLDTADEGLTIDVVDVINGMEFDAPFIEALASLPKEPVVAGDLQPRLGLFVGRLLENLETGLA